MIGTSSIWREPGFRALGAMALLGFSGFMVLMPVVPLWAVRGGSDEAGAGLVNGVTLIATVAFQPLVPLSVRRLGYAMTIAVGLVLLGLPSLGYALSDDLTPILCFSAVRGVGFAVLTVAGSLISAQLAPPGRRGVAIGAYGLAVAAPNLVLVPLSVPIVENWGYTASFWLGALPVLGALTARPLQRAVARHGHEDEARAPGSEADNSRLQGRQARMVLGATVLLLAVTMAGGSLVSFLPQMVDPAPAATALLVFGLAAALCRWLAGPIADRRGPEPLLPMLTTLTALTMGITGVLLVVDGSGWVIVALACAVGVSYGALQNLTMVTAFQAVERRHYATVSAWWNVGFDAGTALGSMAVGAVASVASFGAAMFLVAAVSIVVLPIAVRIRVRTYG